MKRVRLLVSAFRDLEDAAEFYELQERGIGIWFYETLMGEINLLGHFVGTHGKRHGLHCYVSKQFPFGVFYRVTNEVAEVCAIVDLRRNPRTLSRILRER